MKKNKGTKVFANQVVWGKYFSFAFIAMISKAYFDEQLEIPLFLVLNLSRRKINEEIDSGLRIFPKNEFFEF